MQKKYNYTKTSLAKLNLDSDLWLKVFTYFEYLDICIKSKIKLDFIYLEADLVWRWLVLSASKVNAIAQAVLV